MKQLRYTVCDVFTDRPLTGNALAVFTGASGLDELTMQAIARELNLSETVFCERSDAADVRMHIFTPRYRIPFAGHPVLGTAFVFGTPLQKDKLVLECDRGLVPVHLERDDGTIIRGWMDQPLPEDIGCDFAGEVEEALGVPISLPVAVYDNGPKVLVAVAASPEVVAGLAPDLSRLERLPVDSIAAVAVTKGGAKMRVFAPRAGIAEDPATGSAAGPVAWHLARNAKARFGEELQIEQGVEMQRPSQLLVRVHGSSDGVGRIEVGGTAVIVGRGELFLR